MKEEFLEAYQRRIEEIKMLDASPEEKRKLAADAKNEILDQYRNSYAKEKEQEEHSNVEVKLQDSVTKEQEDSVSTIPVGAEIDPIDNIINRLEEREEVGIPLEEPLEFMDPSALFATLDLGDVSTTGEEEVDQIDTGEDLEDGLDNIFMDTEQLFAGLFDDEVQVSDEIIEEKQVVLATELELDVDTKPQLEEPIVEHAIDEINFTSSLETEVVEVEELIEGSIADEEDLVVENSEVDPSNVNELEELEKERERAQKIGIIEVALLIVLIILVIIVVYLIIGA